MPLQSNSGLPFARVLDSGGEPVASFTLGRPANYNTESPNPFAIEAPNGIKFSSPPVPGFYKCTANGEAVNVRVVAAGALMNPVSPQPTSPVLAEPVWSGAYESDFLVEFSLWIPSTPGWKFHLLSYPSSINSANFMTSFIAVTDQGGILQVNLGIDTIHYSSLPIDECGGTDNWHRFKVESVGGVIFTTINGRESAPVFPSSGSVNPDGRRLHMSQGVMLGHLTVKTGNPSNRSTWIDNATFKYKPACIGSDFQDMRFGMHSSRRFHYYDTGVDQATLQDVFDAGPVSGDAVMPAGYNGSIDFTTFAYGRNICFTFKMTTGRIKLFSTNLYIFVNEGYYDIYGEGQVWQTFIDYNPDREIVVSMFHNDLGSVEFAMFDPYSQSDAYMTVLEDVAHNGRGIAATDASTVLSKITITATASSQGDERAYHQLAIIPTP